MLLPPTLLTFPGIGSVAEDTHEGMAVLEKNLDELRAAEFPAFQAGIEAGADFVMVSHVSAPNVVGDNTPCSLSEEIMTNLPPSCTAFNTP